MKKFQLILLILFLVLGQDYVQGQDQNDSTAYRVETKDGNTYTGIILQSDPGKIVLRTPNIGDITIATSEISRISPVDPLQYKKGGYWFENPQATRYFFTANGYGLKKGEGYYQNVWVMFNQVAIGVTDNFSIGAGAVPLFLFGGASTPIWITPKLSIPISKDKLNLGVGALIGTVAGEESAGFGILYGISTFGSKDKNLSIGLGWGYGGGEIATTPTVTVSALIRTGPRGYFLTENYFIDVGSETLGLISMGGRRIIGKAGLDFGAFIPLGAGNDVLVAIPWLGVTIPFGKTQPSKSIER